MVIGLVKPHKDHIIANKVELWMFLDTTLSSIILSDEAVGMCNEHDIKKS